MRSAAEREYRLISGLELAVAFFGGDGDWIVGAAQLAKEEWRGGGGGIKVREVGRLDVVGDVSLYLINKGEKWMENEFWQLFYLFTYSSGTTWLLNTPKTQRRLIW